MVSTLRAQIAAPRDQLLENRDNVLWETVGLDLGAKEPQTALSTDLKLETVRPYCGMAEGPRSRQAS